MNKRASTKPSVRRPPKKNRKKKQATTPAQRLGGLKPVGLIMAGLAALVVVSIGFTEAYRLIVGCDYLRVTHIDVQGACVLTPDAVVQKAGIRYGDNILSVNLSRVRRQLVAEPWILEAEVSRTLPSDLVIRIRERSPLAVVDLGECFLVGQDGRLFKKLKQPDETLALPVIHGVDYRDIDNQGCADGKAFCAAIAALKTAGRVAHLIDGMKIKAVAVDRDTGITISGFETAQIVRLGYGDYFDKFRRLKNVLWRTDKTTPRRRIAAVDLENPDRVVVKMAVDEATQKGGEHAGTGYSRRS
ncbi:MAG: FtsQ-type POTRA domain-containing protein [Thermodesulfobacteriota bacterium]|nr:FtsQ-type POTRA domain-containing protein [Thermodesulfobacteriota bacterium]